MEYKDFTSRNNAYAGFIQNRKEVLDSISDGSFNDVFADLCAKALSGDCIAQDCVAYFFNKGVPNLLSQNYTYYMSWQILAGANGNEFALEKMEFFLNPALEEIVNDEEILMTALHNRTITKDNALMMISNLICEGIVDVVGIEAKNLIDIKKQPEPYSSQRHRVFSDAMENCLMDVIRFLMH